MAISRVRQAVYGTQYWTYDYCRRTNYLSHFISLFPLFVFVFTSYFSCLFVFRDRSEPQVSSTPSWKCECEKYPTGWDIELEREPSPTQHERPYKGENDANTGVYNSGLKRTRSRYEEPFFPPPRSNIINSV